MGDPQGSLMLGKAQAAYAALDLGQIGDYDLVQGSCRPT